MKSSGKRSLVCLLSCAVMLAGTPVGAFAEMLPTSFALQGTNRGADIARIDAIMASAEVSAHMQKLGVDPQSVERRIAALTDSELHQLAERLESDPAAGDALAIIGATFLVLLILEVVGVIDIFKSIGPARR
ncbi:MAG: PA2779 family protein [Steroidobacteraceae bacterium]